MKLTAILSNYNHAQYLPHALDALLAQSRSADELIVFDDASTDNSVKIIESYLKRYPKIRFLQNMTNAGVIRNMNRGLELAAGDVVYFASADDVTYPALFEHGMALLEAHPNAALFSARCEIIDKEGGASEPFPTPSPLSAPGFIEPARAKRELLRDDSWFVGGTTLYSRALLITAGGFPSDLGAFCDGYISRYLALKYGSCYAPVVLCAWRRMEGGMAWSQATNQDVLAETTKNAERRMLDAVDVFPSNYIRRWRGRHLFGARRFSMMQMRAKTDRKGIYAAIEKIRDAIHVAWLFFIMRPRDLTAVIWRRMKAGGKCF